MISNQQIVSWAYGDKGFVSRRSIFFRDSLAIVEKNNKALVQRLSAKNRSCYLLVT